MDARTPLKDARFVRKLAKRLGLHPHASAERVRREIEVLVQRARSTTPAAGAAGTPLASVDLDALLAEVAAKLPLAREVKSVDTSRAAIALPVPLEAVRRAQSSPEGST